MKINIPVLLLIVTPAYILPQIDTSSADVVIENLLDDVTVEKEDSEVFELFENLIDDPIKINSASVQDILRIPFLNYTEAQTIINYRKKVKIINSADQLLEISNISTEQIQRILPFISFENNSTSVFKSFSEQLSFIKLNFRSRVIQDLQIRNGFSNNSFLGSPQKLYNRLKLIYPGKMNIGVLFEKDAGETSVSDFSSFNFSVKNLSFINNLTIGDYLIEFGQGLAIWSPYGFSKGSDAVGTSSRNARGIIPYTSSEENNFMRGAAVNFSILNISLSAFFSSHKIDASIDTATDKINSIIIDGYHRTENEIRKKDALGENIFGMKLSRLFDDNLHIGFLYYKSSYDHFFSNPSLSNRKTFQYFSTSYSSVISKLCIIGETAFYDNAVSTINIADFSVDKNITLVFSYRNFSASFISMKGNAFGEKGIAQGESGFYTGLRFRTALGTFNLYYDQFKFPPSASANEFTKGGRDFLIFFNHKILKDTEIRIRYKNERKETEAVVNNENGLINKLSQNIRLEAVYKISSKLKFKTRFEFVNIFFEKNMSKEKGYLVFQDASFQPNENLTFLGRIIFFQTDSYESRVYEFENDIPGVMTNPSLFGEGNKWYLIVKYKTQFGFSLSLKYSELYKPFVKSIGSGNSEIQGGLDNKLSFQFDFVF